LGRVGTKKEKKKHEHQKRADEGSDFLCQKDRAGVTTDETNQGENLPIIFYRKKIGKGKKAKTRESRKLLRKHVAGKRLPLDWKGQKERDTNRLEGPDAGKRNTAGKTSRPTSLNQERNQSPGSLREKKGGVRF